MSVFPKSATFESFFVVFAILFLLTILLGLNVRKVLRVFKLRSSTIADTPQLNNLVAKVSDSIVDLLAPAMRYIAWYIALLNPYNDFDYSSNSDGWLEKLVYYVIRGGILMFILRKFLLPEICMPIDQYIMFRYRNNRYVTIKYRPIYFVKDIIRGILIPVWIPVAALMVCFLMVREILYAILKLIVLLIAMFLALVWSAFSGCGMKGQEEQGMSAA
jgi:hypothetical protein